MAGFPPLKHGRLQPKKRTAGSSAAALTFCPSHPCHPIHGRLSGKSAASGVRVATKRMVFLITSRSRDQASPKQLLHLNRHHWAIENNLHRNKDVILGEDHATSRSDHAPANIASLNNLVLHLLRRIHPSPTLAIERCQDNKNLAISIVCGV